MIQNLTNRWIDKQKVWIAGRNGRTDAGTTPKYIPLTSSVDNKQAKSNGYFEEKKTLSFNSPSKIKTTE